MSIMLSSFLLLLNPTQIKVRRALTLLSPRLKFSFLVPKMALLESMMRYLTSKISLSLHNLISKLSQLQGEAVGKSLNYSLSNQKGSALSCSLMTIESGHATRRSIQFMLVRTVQWLQVPTKEIYFCGNWISKDLESQMLKGMPRISANFQEVLDATPRLYISVSFLHLDTNYFVDPMMEQPRFGESRKVVKFLLIYPMKISQ